LLSLITTCYVTIQKTVPFSQVLLAYLVFNEKGEKEIKLLV